MMSLKQRRSIVLLFAMITGVALLLTRQSAASSAASSALSAAASNSNNGYDLFYITNDYHYYSFQPGTSAPTEIMMPNTLEPYFENADLQDDVTWSTINRSFLVTNPGIKTIYSISDHQSTVIPVDLGNSALKLRTILAAEWGPHGKSISFITTDLTSSRDPTYSYLVVYTADGVLHVITSPTAVDTTGHLIMPHPISSVDGPVGTPHWSPDGRFLACEMQNQNNLRFVDTNCLLNNQPCQIYTLSSGNINENWSNPSWLPDSKHLIFNCTAVIYVPTTDDQTGPDFKSDLCTIGLNGKEYKHLFLMNVNSSPNPPQGNRVLNRAKKE